MIALNCYMWHVLKTTILEDAIAWRRDGWQTLNGMADEATPNTKLPLWQARRPNSWFTCMLAAGIALYANSLEDQAGAAPATWLSTKSGTSYGIKGGGLELQDYQGYKLVLAQTLRIEKLDKDYERPALADFQPDDLLLVKFSPDKHPLCVRKVGGKDAPHFSQLVADRQGIIYGMANFGSNSRLRDRDLEYPLTHQGNGDFLLAKWSTNLDLVFVRSYGGPHCESADSFALTPQGRLLVAGEFKDTLRLPGSGTTIVLRGQKDKFDFFVASLDLQGQCGWARRVGGADLLLPAAIDADGDGNCLLTGGFDARLQFEGAPDSATLIGRGAMDFFLVKYRSNGDFAWARQGGGPEDDYGVWALMDDHGACYITGRYGPEAWFGEGTGKAPLAAKNSGDMFMACYDREGGLAGVLRVGGPGPWVDAHWSIVWDAAGNRYLVGETAKPALVWKTATAPASVVATQTAQADSPIDARSRFDTIFRAPDGSIQITLSSHRDTICVIEASTDLDTWTAISTNSAPGGRLAIEDHVSSGVPMRFFRVRQL